MRVAAGMITQLHPAPTEVALRKEIAALRAHVAQLQHLVDSDPLTGLANRRALARELARTILRAGRGVPASVALLDLDSFKAVNDRYGHAMGDVALCHMAMHLRAGFRDSDFIGRIGGDEFVLILPDAVPAKAQARLVEIAAQLHQSPLLCAAGVVRLSFAWGVTGVCPSDVPNALIARADAALYRTKRTGRAFADQRSDR